MRKSVGIGFSIFIFAFMHAYYGVGSLKNSFGANSSLSGVPLLLALAFGVSWIAYFAGSAALMMKKPVGALLIRAASAAASASSLAGIFLYPPAKGDFHGYVFSLSPAAAHMFVFTAFSFISLRPDAGSGSDIGLGRRIAWAAAFGAALPWSVGLIHFAYAGSAFIPSGGKGAFICVFMSLWSALPFAVLVASSGIAINAREVSYAFRGGFAGCTIASLYVYGLIWVQGFNSFIMALLAPVVFSSEFTGMALGLLMAKSGNDGAMPENGRLQIH